MSVHCSFGDGCTVHTVQTVMITAWSMKNVTMDKKLALQRTSTPDGKEPCILKTSVLKTSRAHFNPAPGVAMLLLLPLRLRLCQLHP